MVHAYHVIIGAYGFWLPNDPRGSWSQFVGSWDLFCQAGPATTSTETQSLARTAHDWQARRAAKDSLKYPAVSFTGIQAKAIGEGFANYSDRSGTPIWACAILPEHIHLVIGRTQHKIEQVSNHLKGAATRRLVETGIHPLAAFAAPGKRPPKCFARGECSPYLETVEDILRAIGYVEENPLKEGKPRQRWKCVTPFHDGRLQL